MPRSILVPLDGSALAERAVPLAARLARDAAANVLLVYARPPLEVNARHPEAALIGRVESHRAWRRAFRQLHAISQQLLDTGLTAQILLERGPAAEVILEVARRRDVDLIAMSSHGDGGASRWLLGSVADEVCRRATLPVLIVTARCDRDPRPDRPLRVLVALDGFSLAEHALQVVQEWSAAVHVQPVLLRVVGQAPERDVAERYLVDIVSALPVGLDRPTIRIEVGSPASAIVRVGDEENIDMIAIGTHGRGGLARAILGSVATRTLQLAHVPVLVCPRGVPAGFLTRQAAHQIAEGCNEPVTQTAVGPNREVALQRLKAMQEEHASTAGATGRKLGAAIFGQTTACCQLRSGDNHRSGW
jgi:nucleotide-binding universal stress UspA family protein